MLRLERLYRRSRRASLKDRNTFSASRIRALVAEALFNAEPQNPPALTEADIAFDACRVLSDSNIPCYMWGEHALAYYGVPAFVWDVSLLVEEPEVAEKPLLEWGLVRTKPNPRFSSNDQIRRAPRLAVPIPTAHSAGAASQPPDHELPIADEENPGWILLRASDWPNSMIASKGESYIPPLSTLLNCLISTYMETFDIDHRSDLACHISYFYSYFDEVTTDEFAKKIMLENRQFHFDQLTQNHDRQHIIFEKVLVANRAIRERIRRGELVPTKDGKVASPSVTRALYVICETGEQR